MSTEQNAGPTKKTAKVVDKGYGYVAIADEALSALVRVSDISCITDGTQEVVYHDGISVVGKQLPSSTVATAHGKLIFWGHIRNRLSAIVLKYAKLETEKETK